MTSARAPTILPASNLLLPNIKNWDTFMKLYNYVSTVHVHWKIELEYTKDATNEQIEAMKTQYPEKVQAKLDIIVKGVGESFSLVDSNTSDIEVTHVVISHCASIQDDGKPLRCIIVCAFNQTTSDSYIGLVGAIGLSGVIGWFYGAFVGMGSFFAKVAMDRGFTFADVATCAAIKQMQQAGLITIHKNGIALKKPDSWLNSDSD